MGAVVSAVPGEEGFAQPRARRNHADGRARHGIALMQRVYVPRIEHRDGAGNRLQIVEQVDHVHLQRLGQRLLFQQPGQVGHLGAAFHHRPSHAEDGAIDGRVILLCHKIGDHSFEAGITAAGEGPLSHRRMQPRLRHKQRQIGLGSADVSG